MTFQQFQATGRDVDDLRAIPEIAAQTDFETVAPGRVYADGLFIEGTATDGWCLTISNGSQCGHGPEALEGFERALYAFGVAEGYLDAPVDGEAAAAHE